MLDDQSSDCMRAGHVSVTERMLLVCEEVSHSVVSYIDLVMLCHTELSHVHRLGRRSVCLCDMTPLSPSSQSACAVMVLSVKDGWAPTDVIPVTSLAARPVGIWRYLFSCDTRRPGHSTRRVYSVGIT